MHLRPLSHFLAKLFLWFEFEVFFVPWMFSLAHMVFAIFLIINTLKRVCNKFAFNFALCFLSNYVGWLNQGKLWEKSSWSENRTLWKNRHMRLNICKCRNEYILSTGGPRNSRTFYLQIRLFTLSKVVQNNNFLVKNGLFIREFRIHGPKWRNVSTANLRETCTLFQV